MRLKYYLRGVGIGIVVTTIIFMISISLHKNDTEPQNSAAENDKSTTVSEAEENAQKADVAGTETESADTGKTDLADTQAADKADADKPDKNESDVKQPDASKTDEDNSDEKKPSEDTAKDNTASGQQSSDKETESKKKNTEKKNTEKKNTEKKSTEKKSTEKNTEKVRFEIKGGEYSDTVCQKLKAAGLIDDAKAFNEFLVQKDYDNGILPGIYDIPKDATYEEIAALLTTKVE